MFRSHYFAIIVIVYVLVELLANFCNQCTAMFSSRLITQPTSIAGLLSAVPIKQASFFYSKSNHIDNEFFSFLRPQNWLDLAIINTLVMSYIQLTDTAMHCQTYAHIWLTSEGMCL